MFNSKQYINTNYLKKYLLFVSLSIILLCFNSCKNFDAESVNISGEQNFSSQLNIFKYFKGEVISSNEIKLKWDLESPKNYNYSIFRGEQYIATTSNTYFNDAGLNANTTYNYKIYASNIETGHNYASADIVLNTSYDPNSTNNSEQDLIFEDNFNSSTISSYWNGLTNTKSINGALQFYFEGGTNPSYSFAEARFDLKQQYNEITIMYDLYIPNNYFHRDYINGSDNNKLLRVWTNTYDDIEKMGLSMGHQDSNGNSFVGEDYSLQSDWGLSTYVNSSNNFITTDDHGKWVAIKIYVKTASDSAPAQIKLYKNSQLIHQNLNIQNNYIAGQQGVRHGYLLGWANSGFSEDTYILIDNVSFYSGEK